MTDIDLNPATRYGPVAELEYAKTLPAHQPELSAWLGRLPDLSDDDLFWAAASAIHGAALANRHHEHCKAVAAYQEAQRRHLAAGHADDCTGDTIYRRAYAQVWHEQGLGPVEHPPVACDCGAEATT